MTTFGESHGSGVGAVVDGCPSMLELSEGDIQPQLDRRRPGQSGISTPRDERDQVKILSGVECGVTLGTPIALFVANGDQRPGDYGDMSNIPRPSHADYTYRMRYGIKASSGGGRASARETVGRVAAGAVAEKWLRREYGVEVVAWVSSVGEIEMTESPVSQIGRALVDTTPIRCPQISVAEKMIKAVEDVRDRGDSLGGVVTCECRGLPAGIGEPVFGKIEALLAQAMMSIPAARGFEIGSGFSCAHMRGSEHNDLFEMRDGRLGTETNNSGGVQGGISNGETIVFRVAFKPPATIGLPQATVTYDGVPVTLESKGRHDPCVVPRAVPIIESMASIILADLALKKN